MPSIAQMASASADPPATPSSGKKRKRPLHGSSADTENIHLSSTHYYPQAMSGSDPRALFATELSIHLAGDIPLQQQRLFLKPKSLKSSQSHDMKRQRMSLPEGGSELYNSIYEQDSPSSTITPSTLTNDDSNTSAAQHTTQRKPDLSPCHICHRKPKVRTDLDSYDNCEGCGERTCYICLRQCLGRPLLTDKDGQIGTHFDKDDMRSFPQSQLGQEKSYGRDLGAGQTHSSNGPNWANGEDSEQTHRGMVCSRCCVEQGADGEVRCLGCLRRRAR